MSNLTADDFNHFFTAIHGYEPFPWQTRLIKKIADEGRWPEVLDLPTGSEKTAAIDIAIFHLALEGERGEKRRAPVRIAFVVDRRLVVDDAFARARILAKRLASAERDSIVVTVAGILKKLSGGDVPLIVRRLRGGVPREDDWARTPAQPTVLCSTVDQIGSRLLFRGYGVSDRMKPVHAGLIGSDCLILLDEAHLAEPFRQTLKWVATYREQKWRDTQSAYTAPWSVAYLTATPGAEMVPSFALENDDYENETLSRRLNVSKPARLILVGKTKKGDGPEDDVGHVGRINWLQRFVDETQKAALNLRSSGIEKPAIGIVLNRVARARAVFERLRKEMTGIDDNILMIGPARPVDRDEMVKALAAIKTRNWRKGEARLLEKSIIVVATQCIEAGVDIDLDGLITEAAPLDALRQRFGRLNRSGREMTTYAAIIAMKGDWSDDPVYANSLRPTWDYLLSIQTGNSGVVPIVDFGLNAFQEQIQEKPFPKETLSPRDDAPILLPAHVDLFSQTSPIPAADPDVALYLHGIDRQPDAVTVIWRADLALDLETANVRRLFLLVPPRSTEGIELPVWAVHRWLTDQGKSLSELADVAAAEPIRELNPYARALRVFRWSGDDERSRWITPDEIRPGHVIIVPAKYGGLDGFGWNPNDKMEVQDVGDKASRPFSGRYFAVRVAPSLLGSNVQPQALTEAIADSESEHWQDLRSAINGLSLPANIKDGLSALDRAKRRHIAVKAYTDIYGYDAQDRLRGVVFVAQLGINGGETHEDGRPGATEDDFAGSMPGISLPLEIHSLDVERKAEEFARCLGMPADRIADLKLSGYLHDTGKVDPRFQAWLHYGDPLGPDLDDPAQILAKSGRFLPAAAREASGLPSSWRHEAFSVRLAMSTSRFTDAKDPELVLWLVGSHHGYGRPFFPHHDPDDQKVRDLPAVCGLPQTLMPGDGPQSLAFKWSGLDWPGIYERLKARYGIWELARMEAILRLADHRASEDALVNRALTAGEIS